MEPSEQAAGRPKQKLGNACEACRVAKVRCQPGAQPGICKRCSEYKRECVFRTGPRTRRSRLTKSVDTPNVAAPPGPSKTFSIDFEIPADEDVDEEFEELRRNHVRYIDEILDSDESGLPMEAKSRIQGGFNFASRPSPSSTAGSSTHSRPLSTLGIKPQFNLDSAEKLLDSFKEMLPRFPIIVLPEDATVKTMSKETPFVLLGILAVSSCSSSLQGFSLYDEEFRKVLGVKYVASGERSVELLQGLLIYCSWYPFHLRPSKSRQALQYLRMAVEIVHELELESLATFDPETQPELIPETLESLRAFLTCFKVCSMLSWTKTIQSILPYTDNIGDCCNLFERLSTLEGDQVLVWLVRLQHLVDEEAALQWRPKSLDTTSEHHRSLIQKGLENQLRDWQSKVPEHISAAPSVMLASLFTTMFVSAAPLMGNPRGRRRHNMPLDPAVLVTTIHTVRAWFEYVITLSDADMERFSGSDWGQFILVIILGYRLSLPVPAAPDFDYLKARELLDFSSYLDVLCQPNPGHSKTSSQRTDVVTAFKVVLRTLRDKYVSILAATSTAVMPTEEVTDTVTSMRGCPMIDGSMREEIPLWAGTELLSSSSNGMVDPTLSASLSDATAATPYGVSNEDLAAASKPVFHDLWATMTLGWAEDWGDIDMIGAEDGYGGIGPG